MKHLILAAIAICLFTGCATLSQSDSYLLQEHHVSPALYERMSHKDFLSLSDIIELSQKKVPSTFIIHYVWSIAAVYHLTGSDITRLKKAGVSKEVIDYLVGTAAAYGPRPYGYYYSRPVYADPYYAPYPYYGYGAYPTVIIGGGYYGGGYYGHGGGYYGHGGGYWH